MMNSEYKEGADIAPHSELKYKNKTENPKQNKTKTPKPKTRKCS